MCKRSGVRRQSWPVLREGGEQSRREEVLHFRTSHEACQPSEEEAEWGAETKRQPEEEGETFARFLGFFMKLRWPDRPCPSVGQLVQEDEEPDHQRPLWLLIWVWDPPPGAGEEQEGGSGVPAHPTGGPGLHHWVRLTLYLCSSHIIYQVLAQRFPFYPK